MTKRKIVRICYRKLINAQTQKTWERYVFDSSYKEFLMQAQYYDPERKHNTFGEILMNKKESEKLHFLVSSSVICYLQQLNGKIPDALDTLGKHFLEFKNYHFEIINSDVKNKSAHEIAITFFSEPLCWHETVNNSMLLSVVDGEKTEDGDLTHLFQLQSFFSIYSLKEETL